MNWSLALPLAGLSLVATALSLTDLEALQSDSCQGLCCVQSAMGPDAALVRFEAGLSETVLAPNAEQDMFVCFDLQVGVPIDLPPRPGLNLALVIDTSGSMADAGKLDFAKNAALQMKARLAPQDRLGVVAYSNDVDVVWPSTPVANATGLSEVIAGLIPSGSTNLEGGLLAGCKLARGQADGERLNRVLLLSDGLANVGKSTAAELTPDARAAAEDGIRISTMGVGLQYDEVLMLRLARESGGRYQYIADPEQIGAFLGQEIQALERTVARAASIEFELGQGVQLAEVYGYPVRIDPLTRRVTIPVRDLAAGEARRMLVRLRVQPGAMQAGQVIRPATLRYTPVAGAPTSAACVVSAVGLSDDASLQAASRDRSVQSKLEVVRGALLIDQAVALRNAGNLDAAVECLRAGIEHAREVNATYLRCGELQGVIRLLESTSTEMVARRDSVDGSRDLDLEAQFGGLGYL